ncbi:hypothetical protein ACFFX0_14725 [Citricoccus parietis]|uniref:Uncharacterized protein n=1 Tax=Citricoccus parietis TaxID=592307 RepID=A0ABV5G0B2_9MICC
MPNSSTDRAPASSAIRPISLPCPAGTSIGGSPASWVAARVRSEAASRNFSSQAVPRCVRRPLGCGFFGGGLGLVDPCRAG